MEDRAVKILTIRVVIASIVISCALFYLPSFSLYIREKVEEIKVIQAAIKAREEMTALDLLTYNTELIKDNEEIFIEQIRLYLPRGITKTDVSVSVNPLEKRIDFVIPNSRESDLNLHPIVGSSQYISDMTVWQEKDGLHVSFWTDVVVEPRMTGTEGYCYVQFYKPRELYDYVIVVDAGHGGSQPGAVKSGYKEKDINLDIVFKMKEILDEMDNVRVYYTRLADVDVELPDRAALARDSEANLFISIHQNSVTNNASATKGVQVFYDVNAPQSDTNSYAFAMICKEEMMKATGCEDKGLKHNDNIHILRESKVPVALVECGFMSHREELENLTSEEYQEKIARALCDAIKRALEEGF